MTHIMSNLVTVCKTCHQSVEGEGVVESFPSQVTGLVGGGEE